MKIRSIFQLLFLSGQLSSLCITALCKMAKRCHVKILKAQENFNIILFRRDCIFDWLYKNTKMILHATVYDTRSTRDDCELRRWSLMEECCKCLNENLKAAQFCPYVYSAQHTSAFVRVCSVSLTLLKRSSSECVWSRVCMSYF